MRSPDEERDVRDREARDRGPRDRGAREQEARAHGALIEVLELGVLLLGPSGIGKSECALELIRRGHRLVADDVVQLRRERSGRVVGTAPELIRHYMEIRGIGILHIPDLYGPDAVRKEATIDLLCHFERWREDADYERVGLERSREDLLGVEVPSLVLPLRPAGNMATLVEVAVRDTRRRRTGENPVARLDDRVRRLSEGGSGTPSEDGGRGSEGGPAGSGAE